MLDTMLREVRGTRVGSGMRDVGAADPSGAHGIRMEGTPVTSTVR